MPPITDPFYPSWRAAACSPRPGWTARSCCWDLPAEKLASTLDAGTTVRALAASADGKALASAGDDGAVQLWDPATGKPGLKLTGATDWLLAVAFSPDGKTVAAAGYDGHLRMWDAATGKIQIDVLAQPPPAPTRRRRPPTSCRPWRSAPTAS